MGLVLRKGFLKTILSAALISSFVCINAFAAYGNTGQKSDYHGNTVYGTLYGDTKSANAKTDVSPNGETAYVYIEGCSSNGSPIYGLVGESYAYRSVYISKVVGTYSTPTTWHSAHGCDHLSGNDELYLWITA